MKILSPQLCASLLLSIWLFSTTAAAQGDSLSMGAKEFSDLGERSFKSGRYADSITAFQQAYLRKPSPIFLFDIAQAHRLLGQRREAIQMYERFLREAPTTPLRRETEAHLHALQGVEVKMLRSNKEAPPVYKRFWFWGTLGLVAAGAVTTGIVLGTRPPDRPDIPFVPDVWMMTPTLAVRLP